MSIQIINRTRTRVEIDKKYKIVKKYFLKKYLNEFPNIMNREVYWLKKMKTFDRTPNLISYDHDESVVVMSYMGERLSKENIPNDYKQQMYYILNEFKKYGCNHNDIKPRELLVCDKKINIVDFGWSTKIGEPIPEHWPNSLGASYRQPDNKLDDEYSFRESIKSILTLE